MHMGARRNFSRVGGKFLGGAQKICEGGGPFFLDKL